MPATSAGNGGCGFVTFPLTFVTFSVILILRDSRSRERTCREGIARHGGEGGARGRSCKPLPGGFGHHLAGTTTGPWGAPLDWDRQGRVTPAPTASMLPPEGGPLQIGVLATSQETWPEVARSGRKPASQSRGGTPIGVRLLLEARPCQQHGRLDTASVGVPYPFLSVLPFVIAGLDPAIHRGPPLSMDHRIKSGGDEEKADGEATEAHG